MEAATQCCWFMCLARFKTPTPNFSTFLLPLSKNSILGEVPVPGLETLPASPNPSLVLYFSICGCSLTINRRAVVLISKNNN